ncbi:MAG TPA: hypothetical protein VMV05_06300 [bacterium]|nr:hypothetical protein [bacterium]
MNTLTHRLTFFALLIAAALVLPACGSKGEVKSQKAPETVLSPESTPTEVPTTTTADTGMPVENEKPESAPASYVEKIKRTKGTNKIVSTSTPDSAAITQASTPQNTPMQPPIMDTSTPTSPKKGGSGWVMWVLLVLVGGGGGWYFWSKRQEASLVNPNQPKPPVGGLSPVSGYTGKRTEYEAKDPAKTSIWFKKLF